MNIIYDFSTALLQARQRKGATQVTVALALSISHAVYYTNLISLLADECKEWIKTL